MSKANCTPEWYHKENTDDQLRTQLILNAELVVQAHCRYLARCAMMFWTWTAESPLDGAPFDGGGAPYGAP